MQGLDADIGTFGASPIRVLVFKVPVIFFFRQPIRNIDIHLEARVVRFAYNISDLADFKNCPLHSNSVETYSACNVGRVLGSSAKMKCVVNCIGESDAAAVVTNLKLLGVEFNL